MEFSSPDQFLGLLALASFALALGLWLSARHTNRRDAERQRCLALAVEDERDDTADELSEEDRALIELGGAATYRPGDRIALATRVVTGWELAQLAPDLISLSVWTDLDRFMVRELAEDAKFREAYTALPYEQPIIVADYGRMVLPEALYEEPLVVDPPLSLREERIVVPEVTA